MPGYEKEDFEVFAENWQAFEVFLACRTQWRYAGMGSAVGLDYPALQSVMVMLDVTETKETFQKVQLIEQGALKAISDKHK